MPAELVTLLRSDTHAVPSLCFHHSKGIRHQHECVLVSIVIVRCQGICVLPPATPAPPRATSKMSSSCAAESLLELLPHPGAISALRSPSWPLHCYILTTCLSTPTEHHLLDALYQHCLCHCLRHRTCPGAQYVSLD